MAFVSTLYGYTVTLPAGWTSVPANKKWDGDASVSSDSPEVDQFISTSVASSWGIAAPWTQDLAAYTTFLVSWNHRHHGDTCPAKPQTTSQVTVGGMPGVLLEYDCGILINLAAAVHDGVGYWFAFRDPDVRTGASDPKDHATFVKILESVQFPG